MKRLTLGLSIASLLFCGMALISCGGTDGGKAGDQSFDGTSFDDENAGRIALDLNDDQLSVSEMTGFTVSVTDDRGDPVSNIEIACDTERGLALIEPLTGFELTGASGEMSGKVGCNTPGSYQIGCRLPSGAFKRSLKTVRCQGPTPSGFSGFAGAGGGTLGTGTGSGGSTDTGSARITSVTATETGGDTLSIDVIQGLCGTAPSLTAEPFTDTILKIAVRNDTLAPINFFGFQYVVDNADGQGSRFSSRQVALTNGGDVPASGSTTLEALFLKAVSPGNKRFTGASFNIPSDLGFRNVTITLTGTNSLGEEVEVSTTVGFAFGNYDKCTTSAT